MLEYWLSCLPGVLVNKCMICPPLKDVQDITDNAETHLEYRIGADMML